MEDDAAYCLDALDTSYVSLDADEIASRLWHEVVSLDPGVGLAMVAIEIL